MAEQLLPLAAEAPPERLNLRLHALLFLLTLATTTWAGTWLAGADPLDDWRNLGRGLPFSLSLLLVLGIHETAHFLASRSHGVRATLPYFIPMPTLVGTMGAVIRIKSRITDRRALLDLGVSGPLAGFLAAIPVTIAGLRLSEVQARLAPGEGGIALGSSLLFTSLTWLFAPGGVEGTLVLHPVAFAGWFALLVTAFNLLPVGQLDGGHIAAALLGDRHRALSLGSLLALLPLGLLWEGWWVWALLLAVMGWGHPPVDNPRRPLGRKRVLLGWAALVVLAITFTPSPFTLP